MPHRGEQRADPDPVPGRRRRGGAGGHPVQHGPDHLGQGQAPLGVQFGREPDLRVDHPVGGQVLHAFGGHPDQAIPGSA